MCVCLSLSLSVSLSLSLSLSRSYQPPTHTLTTSRPTHSHSHSGSINEVSRESKLFMNNLLRSELLGLDAPAMPAPYMSSSMDLSTTPAAAGAGSGSGGSYTGADEAGVRASTDSLRSTGSSHNSHGSGRICGGTAAGASSTPVLDMRGSGSFTGMCIYICMRVSAFVSFSGTLANTPSPRTLLTFHRAQCPEVQIGSQARQW